MPDATISTRQLMRIIIMLIAVWSITDEGNIPPLYQLTNPNGPIGGGSVALNPNNKEVVLGGRTSVSVYSFPEIF